MRHRITTDEWDSALCDVRKRVANDLVRMLPDGFDFTHVSPYQLGGQAHPVAHYRYRGARFVLVPGGKVELGYDPATFSPSDEQAKSWRGTVAQKTRFAIQAGTNPMDPSLENYIRAVSSPHRTVTLQPFLMEVDATEAETEPLPLDHPEVLEWAKRYQDDALTWESFYDGCGPLTISNNRLRVAFNRDGPTEAYRICWKSGDECRQIVKEQGFRLPTADEFEHACRAGSRTLFRWGDRTPPDFEPNPLLENPPWTRHRLPSAFGVNIAQNPWAYEYVMEPDVVCGGDGGCAVCSGSGTFCSWLTLSSAFRSRSWGSGANPMPGAHYRRVMPLEECDGRAFDD